jgi:enamine deaminase RidA (YjgF/YER057c/UK114 family)
MTTAVTLIRAPQLAQAPYAHAATIAVDARLLFLAGSCPLAADGTVVPGGIAVVATRVLVASTERSELVEAWTVVHDRFGAHDVPSTLIGVTVLGYPGQLVEIEATAGVVE